MITMFYVRGRRFLQRILTRPRIDLPLAFGLFVLAMVGLATLYSAGDGSLALVTGQAARFALGGL
ncbi:MAG: rod shape-determining protein RodA, partial [Rhodanobacter sp.]|nr:rod shape-determining protein RodA [Rhodanobacter sp.]